MHHSIRKIIARAAIWLIVLVMVYRVGACPCQCIRHSIWFDAISYVVDLEAADGCDEHGHDHGHAPVPSDTLQICGQHCDCVPQNIDLWRCDRTTELGANDFAMTLSAMGGAPSSITVSDGDLSRLIVSRHGGISLPLEVRAARQVFQL